MHSMAEHEAEMQRQMMSVPPGTQMMNGPPPNIGMHQPNIPGNANGNAPNFHPGNMPPMMQPPMMPPHNMMPAMSGGHNANALPPGDGMPPNFNGQQNEPDWTQDEVDKSAHSLPSLMSVKVDRPDDLKANKASENLVLPKALEDVFAFKDQLADELGRADGEIPIDTDKYVHRTTGVISTDYADADADSDDEEEPTQLAPSKAAKGQHRMDKNKKKKQRKKQNKKNRQAKNEEKQTNGEKEQSNEHTKADLNKSEDDVTIEYVPDKITVADLAPMYRQFYRVFEVFKLEDKPTVKDSEVVDDKNAELKKDKERMMTDDDEDMDEDTKDDKEKLSKRKMKKLTRLSVAELKQLVGRPDVVEMHDVTARDPKLLVQLKAHRNTVQVPRHWCFKRKYLQGKRGIEKPPFDLPAFIKKTGIMEMRASLQEKDEAKTLKAKMRERARPKMGKIDIDYQKLHDAFFK